MTIFIYSIFSDIISDNPGRIEKENRPNISIYFVLFFKDQNDLALSEPVQNTGIKVKKKENAIFLFFITVRLLSPRDMTWSSKL